MSQANLITKQLLEISRREVVHLSALLANATGPHKATLLSPELSDGMAAALLIYKQFLTKRPILNSRHDELDATRNQMSAAWRTLIETVAAFMPGDRHRALLKAWKTADERLAAILAKECTAKDGKKVYTELVKALEDASKAVEAGIAAVRHKPADQPSPPRAVVHIRTMQGEDKPLFTDKQEAEIKQLLKIDRIEDLERFDRATIAKQNLSFEGHASLLMALMQYKLRNAPNPEWSAAFSDYETAANAAILWDLREEVCKGVSRAHLLRGTLDGRSEYDGLRFKKLVLDLIDTFFDVFDAADFYSGLRQIEFYETPAARIMAHTHALIRILEEATNEPGRFYHGFKLSQLDPSRLPRVIHALLSFLNSICHKNLFAKEFDIKELETNLGWSPDLEANEEDEIYFHQTLADVTLTLKELLTELRFREHEVYDQHPEWDIPVGEYNISQDRQSQSRALHAYCKKYVDKNGVNPVRHFVEMANVLNSGEANITDYLTWLKNLLETPPAYSYESKVAVIESADQDSEITAQINPWIVDAKKSMVNALLAFCNRRANALPPEGKARELWLRVNAKIRLASHGVETEAKAIVETMKQAAEQELVEQPMQSKKSKANMKSQPSKTKKPVGRPKTGADEKNAQVAHGINWLLEHYPDGNPNEAAQFVFTRYPNFHDKGHAPPKEGKRIADTSLAKAIRREWDDIPDKEKAEKAAKLKAGIRT